MCRVHAGGPRQLRLARQQRGPLRGHRFRDGAGRKLDRSARCRSAVPREAAAPVLARRVVAACLRQRRMGGPARPGACRAGDGAGYGAGDGPVGRARRRTARGSRAGNLGGSCRHRPCAGLRRAVHAVPGGRPARLAGLVVRRGPGMAASRLCGARARRACQGPGRAGARGTDRRRLCAVGAPPRPATARGRGCLGHCGVCGDRRALARGGRAGAARFRVVLHRERAAAAVPGVEATP